MFCATRAATCIWHKAFICTLSLQGPAGVLKVLFFLSCWTFSQIVINKLTMASQTSLQGKNNMKNHGDLGIVKHLQRCKVPPAWRRHARWMTMYRLGPKRCTYHGARHEVLPPIYWHELRPTWSLTYIKKKHEDFDLFIELIIFEFQSFMKLEMKIFLIWNCQSNCQIVGRVGTPTPYHVSIHSILQNKFLLLSGFLSCSKFQNWPHVKKLLTYATSQFIFQNSR